jgi:hypothetical protein
MLSTEELQRNHQLISKIHNGCEKKGRARDKKYLSFDTSTRQKGEIGEQ